MTCQEESNAFIDGKEYTIDDTFQQLHEVLEEPEENFEDTFDGQQGLSEINQN